MNSNSQYTINSIHFQSTLSGWAVGTIIVSLNETSPETYPLILTTIDGGTTWLRYLNVRINSWLLNSVFFVDALNGWACGGGFLDGIIIRTENLATGWGEQYIGEMKPNGAKDLFSIHFIDYNYGWAAG